MCRVHEHPTVDISVNKYISCACFFVDLVFQKAEVRNYFLKVGAWKKVNFPSLLLFLYSNVVTGIGKKLHAEMSEGEKP